MKLPRLPILAVTALTLAMATGMSATAASAARAPATGNSSTASAKPKGHLTAPVTGTFRNATGRGTFTGAFHPKKFMVVNGALKATGLLTGKLTGANGKPLGTVHRTITTTVDTGDHEQAALKAVGNGSDRAPNSPVPRTACRGTGAQPPVPAAMSPQLGTPSGVRPFRGPAFGPEGSCPRRRRRPVRRVAVQKFVTVRY